MIYALCKKVIDSNKYEYQNMLNKLDVYLLGDRLTEAQYTELKQLMDVKK